MKRLIIVFGIILGYLSISNASARVLYSTNFEVSEGYRKGKPLAGQLVGGVRWHKVAGYVGSPIIYYDNKPERVFDGNSSVNVDGKRTVSCYVDFNTNPTVKKVWIEAYLKACYGPSGNGWIRLGLVEPGTDQPKSHMQAVVKIPGYESGNTLYFNTAGGYPKEHARANQLYKAGKWIHIVMAVDYNTRKAKVYSRIVEPGDTSPLTESDVWTYKELDENVGNFITVSGKKNDTVSFVAGKKAYAGRLWIEGGKGVWGFVDKITITDSSPIVTTQDILARLKQKDIDNSQRLPKPLTVVPYLQRAPKLDGRIGDEEWRKASLISGFSNLEGQLAKRQTKVWLGYDKDNLYIAFKSTTDYRQQPIKNRIWHSDAIEFFLSIPDKIGYLQFCGNSAGVRYTAWVNGKGAKVPNWELTNFIDREQWGVGETWSAEIAVPFAELGMDNPPKDGKRWRANFCRDWSVASDKDERYTSWSPVKGSYLQPESFGTLVFDHKASAVQLYGFGKILSGHPKFHGRIILNKPADILLRYKVLSATENPIVLVSKRKRIFANGKDIIPFEFSDFVKFDTTIAVPVNLLFEIQNHNERLLQRAVFPYTMLPPFRVEVVPVFLHNRLDVVFDVRNLANISPDTMGQASLIDANGKLLDSAQATMLGKKGHVLLKLKLPANKTGMCLVNAVLKSSNGSIIREVKRKVDIPAKPQWYGNKLGISDKVPPPFEDVRVEGNMITVWGRRYKLGELLLPEAIKTDGTEILSEPVRLNCIAKSQLQKWTKTECKIKHAKATDAVFEFNAKSDKVSVSGRLSAEYDEILIYDLTVTPLKKQVSISELALEIPIYRRDAAFLRATTWPMSKMGERTKAIAALIGDVKAEKPQGYFPKPTKNYVSIYDYLPNGWHWDNEFIPQLWVGNDRHGLLYFQNSPENMSWKGSPVDVIYHGQTTIIRIKYINIETMLRKPRHYKFALMATPVKKRNRKMERIAFDRKWFTDCVKGGKLRKGFIPALVHWKAGRCEKDYQIVDLAQFRREVSETRSQGMEVILNNSPCLYVENSPEFALYGPEWMEQPVFKYSNHGGSNVTLIKVCPATTFTDYYLWWVKNLIENYDVGGLYFDVTGANGCMNPHHGHGYVKDGVRYPVSDMFALREFYKRIYTLVKEEGERRGRKFAIYQHSGSPICWPYIDLLCRGEYWERVGAQIKKRGWWSITPTYFRAVENAAPLCGSYTFFSGVNDKTGPESPKAYQRLDQEKLAVLLLLDVLPCADKWMTPIFREQWPNENKPGLFDIWKVWEEFDVDSAEWVPYYQKDTRVFCTSPNIKVSFYVHKGRILVVAANLTRKVVDTMLKIDRKRLGFNSHLLKVKYLGSGKTDVVDSDEIPLHIDARDFRLFLVE